MVREMVIVPKFVMIMSMVATVMDRMTERWTMMNT
jgi:hypothetical protein